MENACPNYVDLSTDSRIGISTTQLVKKKKTKKIHQKNRTRVPGYMYVPGYVPGYVPRMHSLAHWMPTVLPNPGGGGGWRLCGGGPSAGVARSPLDRPAAIDRAAAAPAGRNIYAPPDRRSRFGGVRAKTGAS